jgi:hypothetical protein
MSLAQSVDELHHLVLCPSSGKLGLGGHTV